MAHHQTPRRGHCGPAPPPLTAGSPAWHTPAPSHALPAATVPAVCWRAHPSRCVPGCGCPSDNRPWEPAGPRPPRVSLALCWKPSAHPPQAAEPRVPGAREPCARSPASSPTPCVQPGACVRPRPFLARIRGPAARVASARRRPSPPGCSRYLRTPLSGPPCAVSSRAVRTQILVP